MINLFELNYGQEEKKAVCDVLDSKWLTMGPVTQKFEEEFAKFLNIRHAIALSNCTSALHSAHLALGIGPGDEVICPSLTFVATANSITYTGATPVFADVSSVDDWNISPDDIERIITKQTKAITVVHYAGFSCNMDRVLEIAAKYDLKVIEDCAHSLGSTVNGRHLGSFGNISCFSFFSNKNMSTGEGGMVCTDNDEIAEKIRLYRSHGMTSLTLDRHKGHSFSYDVISPGFNFRIDEIHSALGREQLKKLVKDNEIRNLIGKYYKQKLFEIEEISIPFMDYQYSPNYHIFPISLHKDISRNDFMRFMREKGVQTSIHYPPIHKFEYYKNCFNTSNNNLPLTNMISENEVTLPMHPLLKNKDIDTIISVIKAFLC